MPHRGSGMIMLLLGLGIIPSGEGITLALFTGSHVKCISQRELKFSRHTSHFICRKTDIIGSSRSEDRLSALVCVLEILS